jgi:hypothetical protein
MPTPQIQNDPIYSLPHLYTNGMNISVASSTVVGIAPGQARDSMNNIDMPIGFPNLEGITNPGGFYPQTANFGPIPGLVSTPSVPMFSGYPNLATSQPLFINTAVTGANGLDTGTLAASSFYVVWLIGDSRNHLPVAGILSLYSNAFPLLPAGYDSYLCLGFIQTSSGTALENPLNTSSSKGFFLQPAVSVLSGGNATSFTAIDCSAAIPDEPFQIAQLTVTFIPAAVGDTVQFRPTTSTATAGLLTITGVAAGVAQTNFCTTICGVSSSKAEIDYKVTSSSDSVTVLVSGYIQTLA